MSEIKGYLLTEEEQEACLALVKKMREKKIYAVDFSGCVVIKARTPSEASDIFWNWVGDLQDKSSADWHGVVTQSPYFEKENVSLYFGDEVDEEE